MKSKVTFISTNKEVNVNMISDSSYILENIDNSTKFKYNWVKFGNDKTQMFINLQNCFAIQVEPVSEEDNNTGGES